MVDLYEIRLALANHEFAKPASSLMDGLHPGTSRSVFLRDQELILLARLRLAQGRPGEALQSALTRWQCRGSGRMYAWLETWPCRRALWMHLSITGAPMPLKQEAALHLITKALAFAMPEGFVRVFVDQGEAMQRLLAVVERQLSPASDAVSITLKAYVTKLLDAFGGEVGA
jgi:hypothetical protein